MLCTNEYLITKGIYTILSQTNMNVMLYLDSIM